MFSHVYFAWRQSNLAIFQQENETGLDNLQMSLTYTLLTDLISEEAWAAFF